MTVDLDLSNYATKTILKNSTGIDTPPFAKNADLANLKSDVNKLDTDILKNVPNGLSSLKSKVAKLDVAKLVPAPVDLSKLRDVVKNDVVIKDVYNAKIKNIEDEIPDITNLISLSAKINEVKCEVPSITNLATTAALTTVENKIPNFSNLVKKVITTQKVMELKRKLLIMVIV